MQNQDAKMANNLVQSSAENSIKSPLHAAHISATSILSDNNETQFSDNNLFDSDNTIETQFFDSTLLLSDNNINNMSFISPLFSSNVEIFTNVNNVSIQSELKEWAVKCKIPQCHLNELLVILRKHKVIGVDGLSISHSSNSQLWPILAYVKPDSYIKTKKVFPICLFWGKSKPTDVNEFLYDFIVETKLLLTDGLKINPYNLKKGISLSKLQNQIIHYS
ncbi:hypothetical protein AGLY_015831 [Aphis glycines]|uniref:Uncharacterized protein n=1 Tax=Aphis glycines TaxID=307491 RepID=A0A6G0T1H2_APHGL|nr:hypothetical protein AGLY_015831 [Aphis glycines]